MFEDKCQGSGSKTVKARDVTRAPGRRPAEMAHMQADCARGIACRHAFWIVPMNIATISRSR